MADNALGAVYAGAMGPGNIPSELLKYDKDKTGALLYRKRGTAALMHMINTRFGKRTVTSFQPKWFDIDELDYVFNVVEDQDISTQELFRKVKMTNSQAVQLQMNDVLMVDGLYQADGANAGTPGEYSSTWDAQHRSEEQVLVIAEPIMNSAGTGYAYVTLRRGFAENRSTVALMDEPTAVAAGQIKSGTRLLKMANAQFTGSDAPHGRFKQIEIDGNYLQIFRFPFEVQDELDLEKTFLQESPMSINQKLALNAIAYEMEFRALYGRKSKEQQNNSWRFTTGGLYEYLADGNVFDYSKGNQINNWNWTEFQRNVLAPAFEVGGTSSKVAFCSIDTFSGISTMLWDKVKLTVNEQWREEFKFDIYKIAGASGELNLVPSWVYGLNYNRRNQMLVLDFGGPNFAVDCFAQGGDLHINKGKNGGGLQQNGQNITKWEYTGINGLQRRNKQVHSIITGLPILNKA